MSILFSSLCGLLASSLVVNSLRTVIKKEREKSLIGKGKEGERYWGLGCSR